MTVRNDGILRTETDKDTNRSFFPFWICLLFHGWSSFLCIAKSVCLFSVHLFLWRQQNQLLEFSVNGIVICCSIAFSLTRLVWWQSSYRALNAIAENGSTRPFLSHAPQAHIFFSPSSSLHWRQTVMIMMTIGFYEVDIALLLCCTKCNVCYAHRHRIRCRCTECKRWWSENGATGMCAYAFHSNTTHHITLCIQWWCLCAKNLHNLWFYDTLDDVRRSLWGRSFSCVSSVFGWISSSFWCIRLWLFLCMPIAMQLGRTHIGHTSNSTETTIPCQSR